MQQHELFILKRELMILGFLCAFIFGILIAGISAWGIEPLMTWRHAFWAFGAIGVTWCVLFAPSKSTKLRDVLFQIGTGNTRQRLMHGT